MNPQTTFILHGSRTSIDSPLNDLFFAQFTNHIPQNTVKILMCYWARHESRWQELLNRDAPKITQRTTQKVAFTLVKDPKDLLQKLPKHDVLYVAGGDAEPLEKHYPILKDLKSQLRGKVYLGASMGVFMASTYYVLSNDDQDSARIHNGLGLLPLSILCHWDEEHQKEQKIRLLNAHAPKTPILTLDNLNLATFII